MSMHNAVQAYFNADRGTDPDRLVATFHDNAVVTDERARHTGACAIRAWWANSRARYDYTTEPVECTLLDDQIAVRVRVSGAFPGSPAILDFLFTVTHGRIAALEIR